MPILRRTGFESFNSDGNCQNWSRENNHNLELKHIFFGFMGGFYFSEYFQPWMKYLWIFANSMLFVLDLGGLIVYLIVVENKKLGDICFAFFSINTVLVTTVFVPLFTYYFRNEYKLVLELNENKFDGEIIVNPQNVWRSKNRLISVSAYQFIAGQLYALIHLIFLFLIDEEKYLYDVQYHAQPTPWFGKIHTKTQYFCVWILLFLFTLIISLLMTSFTSVCMTTAHEFYLAITILCSRIDTFSKNAENRFSELSRKYRYPCQGAQNEDLDYARETEILRQNLFGHIVKAVKDFQKLTRKSHILKQFIEFAYAMFLTLGFLNHCFFIYIISSQQLEIFQKVKAIIMYVFADIILYGLCITGKSFDDMAEMITNHVQDIPWYYMDSSRSKIVYIFIYLAQKPIRFFGFKMLPMDMNTFLQSLKITYTFYNVLHAALGR